MAIAPQSTGGHEALGYYVNLAPRSLRRNPALTALMIAAIGVGIGTSMTMVTIDGRVVGRLATPDPLGVAAPISGIVERLQYGSVIDLPGSERMAYQTMLLPYRDLAANSFYVVRARPSDLSAVAARST